MLSNRRVSGCIHNYICFFVEKGDFFSDLCNWDAYKKIVCLSEVRFKDIQKFSGDSRKKNHFELILNHCMFSPDVIVKWQWETTPSLKAWIISSILKMLWIQYVKRALLSAFSALTTATLFFSSVFSYPLSSQQAPSIWGVENDFSSSSRLLHDRG